MTPEQDLWKAVLARAFLDALGLIVSGDHRDSPLVIAHARQWLLKDTEDFPLVCRYAGREPGDVRETAAVLAGRGWPAPEGIRQGRTGPKEQKNVLIAA